MLEYTSQLFNLKSQPFRNAAKMKEIKGKVDTASKEGLSCKELKTQLDLLEKEKKKIIDQDEELKKKEKVLAICNLNFNQLI